MLGKKLRLAEYFIVTTGLFISLLPGLAEAYPTYSGCAECHGEFNTGNYTSRHDETVWGNSLMDLHRTWVGNDCLACHMTNGPGDVFTNDSGSGTFSKGCIGCHGRDEDITDNCTGLAASMGGRELDCGSGAGLRQLHESRLGEGTCSTCHASGPTPVGENVEPFNYSIAQSSITDSCNADGSESRKGPTGLDNDGDGRRDNEDSDCQFQINPGLNDAWYYPITAGQGFLITVFEDSGLVFLAWFTYDVERPAEGVTAILGEPGHRWLTAQGPFQGDTATLDVFVSSGGVFDSAEPAVGPPVQDGTMTIQWTGCNSAILSYDIPSAGQGMIPIERITLDNVPLCESFQ